MKLLLAPVGYWRLYPNAAVLRICEELRPTDVLDVSSPKLTSLIVGQQARVVATDLDDQQIFLRWKPIAAVIGLTEYQVRFEDACQLSFHDASFDLVFSISVIEHIPGDGDMQALAEFARVLRPGGVAVIEVPYRRQRQEVFARYDSTGARLAEPRFYERYYDAAWCDERLRADGLRLEQRWILGETIPIDPWIAARRLPRPLRLFWLPLEPWLAAANYWMRPDDRKGRPLAALFVFRKAQ